MIKLFFPGNNVPEWLFKLEPTKGYESAFREPIVKFCGLSAVWAWRDHYKIVSLWGSTQIEIKEGMYFTGTWQSPKNESGGIIFHSSLFSALGF